MNRRPGGNPRFGGRGPQSFSQQPFQGGGGGVNPWQGGSNQNQGGILSQLTSNPQLALALTSLLQPQQQQPPSLLSLNTSPAFSNNRDYGGRYNSGGINRGRDVRRHEPYNKNRQNFGGRKRSPRRDNKDGGYKKPEKKKDEKKEEQSEDVADDEKKETKRDWKDEKNQTEGKESGDEGEKKEGDKDGKYGGVARKYLHCFVCTKQMWDGESMSKHVRGRAHHEMLKALEESIHFCVNILRENLRLHEERKMIEFNRQNRLRKFNQKREPPLSHCAMCDLKFMGKIISHRRTEGHQRLKRYLHPNCRICEKEYPSRIEWVEHCLSPEHLRKVSDTLEKKVGLKEGDDIVQDDGEDVNLDEALEESLHMEGEDPILDMGDSLVNMVDRLPAYKPNRGVAQGAVKEFTGFMCELCHRSFQDKNNADAHLKTKRHYYRFIEHIKERFDKEEKKKKADKEAEKTKTVEPVEDNKQENGAKAEVEEDQEMYDPNEATEEEEKELLAEDEEEEEETVAATDVAADTDMADPSVIDVKVEEPEPAPEPEPEVKATTPTRPVTRKSIAGPKSKRGRK